MAYKDGNLAYAKLEEVEQKTVEEMHIEEEVESVKTIYPYVKRFLDFWIALVSLILLSPLFLVIAILIKISDPGPVLHRRMCVGMDGKTIAMLKFRSMKTNADQLEDILTPGELEQYHKEYKLAHDPRITKVGSFLRKSSLDELPQLIDVLCGDMSLVGPRPLVREELESKYLPFQQKILTSVRPGLTGLWQVNGRSDCTYESGERQKFELSYVHKSSFKTDVYILLKTVRVVFYKVGAR